MDAASDQRQNNLTRTVSNNYSSLVKSYSMEPDFCDVILGEFVKGVAHEANPKFKTEGFTKLLVKGDNCRRYRIELDKTK